jgi:hypothetical protein
LCRSLLNMIQNCNVSYIRKQANRVAHELAQATRFNVSPKSLTIVLLYWNYYYEWNALSLFISKKKKVHVNKLSGKSECFSFVVKKRKEKEDAFNLELLWSWSKLAKHVLNSHHKTLIPLFPTTPHNLRIQTGISTYLSSFNYALSLSIIHNFTLAIQFTLFINLSPLRFSSIF